MPPVCDHCGAVFVEQRMPTRLRYGGAPGKWIPEDEQTFWVHPITVPCDAP